MIWRNAAADIHSHIDQSSQEFREMLAQLSQTLATGLAELHDQNRSLHNALERAQADVADARNETKRARTEAAAIRREVTEALHATRQSAKSAAEELPDGEATTPDLEELLTRAAGTAYAELVCHRDTWDFLVAQAAQGEHFRLPGNVGEEDDGLVEADISGRTIIAILDALSQAQRDQDKPAGTRHLAAQVYTRIGHALQQVQPGKTQTHQTPQDRNTKTSRPNVTRIVIDDRPTPTSH